MKHIVIGSAAWVEQLSNGLLDWINSRPPIPHEPQRKPAEWKPSGVPKSRRKKKPLGDAWRPMRTRMMGQPCVYCKRPMRMPTRDHVHPRSKGGREIVWACNTCNFMKGGMVLPEWHAFMATNPRWWELPHAKKMW